MIKNHFKIAFRSFRRRKLVTFIDITGLTIGLTLVGLIGIFSFESFNIDRHQSAQLYRITTVYQSETTKAELPTVGRALIPRIKADIPEVEAVVPLYPAPLPVKIADTYYFDKVAFAGDAFLESFNFQILKGTATNALDNPNQVLLTASMAEKYFSTTDAVGRTLQLGDSTLLTVSAVIEDIASSHIAVDVIVSIGAWEARGGNFDEWFTWDMTCYALLKPEADLTQATQKIAALSMTHNRDQYQRNGYDVSHRLEAVPDIYLKSPLTGFNKSLGNFKQLYILMAIGIALLLLACINFINLTTAVQVERSKEVGVRKTLGAPLMGLRLQFIVETFSLVVLATFVAYGLIAAMLPLARSLTGMAMHFQSLFHPAMLFGALCLVGATTLLAGLYPATLLASLRPISAIKHANMGFQKGATVRQSLVVFQFATTVVLMACTYICVMQIRHMGSQDLGFQQDQVLVIDLSKTPFREFVSNYDGIKHDLQQLANVEFVSGSAGLPGRMGWNGQLVMPEGFPQERSFTMEVIPSDVDYARTLRIPIVAGRDLQSEIPTDIAEGILLNEAACRQIGWSPDEAIGKRISTSGMQNGKVIGVMADYHQHGLQHVINPILIFNATYAYNFIALSTSTSQTQRLVSEIERLWKSRFPGYHFEFFMLEDDFNTQYKQEHTMTSIIGAFAVLTVFVACLGLIGLAAYVVIQRRKEIGVRKVFGASIVGILALLSKDFVKLVFIAIVIASPITWWLMHQWLDNFAYRIAIEWWMLAGVGLAAVAIALLTVGWQAMRAALANPVDSLRDE